MLEDYCLILPDELIDAISKCAGKIGRVMMRYTCRSFAAALPYDPQEEIEVAREFALAGGDQDIELCIVMARSNHSADTLLHIQRMLIRDASLDTLKFCYEWRFINDMLICDYLQHWDDTSNHQDMLDLVHLIGENRYKYFSKPRFWRKGRAKSMMCHAAQCDDPVLFNASYINEGTNEHYDNYILQMLIEYDAHECFKRHYLQSPRWMLDNVGYHMGRRIENRRCDDKAIISWRMTFEECGIEYQDWPASAESEEEWNSAEWSYSE